ncbi:MAG TPA: response regulator [Tepidisphaeraceae bacterium]|nr:response regulator [Tepidisphaeraceae bacterium]
MATGSCRILIVDDHADSASLLARLLKMDGHVVQTALTLAAAKTACEKDKFDLLISDIGLPDGSGCELMQYVRDRYGMRGIALTGHSEPEDIAATQQAGFETHIVKPVSLPDLSAAIAKIPECGGLQ